MRDLERARQWCAVADDFARTYGCPYLYATCRTVYGSVLVAAGHWPEAERELAAAMRTAGDTSPVRRAQALSRLADLRVRQGRLVEAEALLDEVPEELAGPLPRAQLRLANGEPALAVAELRRWLDAHDDRQAAAAALLATLLDGQLALHQGDEAEATLARLTTLADAVPTAEAVAWAAVSRARMAAARKENSAASAHFGRAIESFARAGLPLETARARLALAHLHAPDAPEVAVAEARAALSAFDQVGAARDADAAAALLRSLGVAGRTGPKHVGLLTAREREVLALVGLGLSNPAIAERLFISRKTAAHHVSNVFAKLGLQNRAEAVAYAARQGITPLLDQAAQLPESQQ